MIDTIERNKKNIIRNWSIFVRDVYTCVRADLRIQQAIRGVLVSCEKGKDELDEPLVRQGWSRHQG